MAERFTTTDVLVLAGGLLKNGSLTKESLKRTDTAAEFVLSGTRKIGKIIVSGGYPLGQEPPVYRKREAPQMAEYLKEKWEIEGVRIEAASRTTVENLAYSIQAGHLNPGEYAEGRRALAIVTNQLHGRRVGLIARYALSISDRAAFRVAPPERKPSVKMANEEESLAKLTAIAIDLAALAHPPGSPDVLDAVNEELAARTSRQWETEIKAFNRNHPNWTAPDLPVISFTPKLA